MSASQEQDFATPAEETRDRVRLGYTSVAQGDSLQVDDPVVQALAFGYGPEQLGDAPSAANLGLGCGDPTGGAALLAGETVLDLGCGAGLDVFIASKAVGPTGTVIGVDMTEALLDQAAATAVRDGYTNVEFRLGTMEQLPLDDCTVDVIVSNCAINLSPEKEKVFAEAMRVLRPGGRIQVSDLVVETDLPAKVKASVEAYVGCVGGAIKPAAYQALISDAGFTNVEVTIEYVLGDIVKPSDQRVKQVLADAGAEYADEEIRSNLASIKGLSVRAQKALQKATPKPEPTQQYKNLLSYVVSNAVAGEIMAVENYSDMVSLLPDVDAKLEAVEQAREEGKHVRQLASLGARIGFEVKKRIIEPEWKSIRATFREAVANNDLPACW